MKVTFLIASAVHILILSLVWVGFPVVLPRYSVEFHYNDTLVPEEELSRPIVSTKTMFSDPQVVRSVEGSQYAPWVKLRNLDKPR